MIKKIKFKEDFHKKIYLFFTKKNNINKLIL